MIGLIALCPDCHEVKHMGLAGMRGRDKNAAAHLARVNQWTPVQTDEYLRQVWEVWAERSRHQWKLDLMLLDRFGIEVESKR